MRYQQATIDTVDVEEYGPLALLSFKYAHRRGSSVALVSAASAASLAKKRSRPVDAAAKLETLLVVTPAGHDVLGRLGPAHLFSHFNVFDKGYPPNTPLYFYDEPTQLREFLSVHDPEELTSRVFVPAGGFALFSPDAPLDALPLNYPVFFEISDQHVNIDAALPHLQSHPLVRAVSYERGRPGTIDHVPAHLYVVAALPDEVRAKIDAENREHFKNDVKKDARYFASPSFFTSALTWRLADDPLAYNDPLGLAPFARSRDEYQRPVAEDEYDGYFLDD